MKRIYLSLPDTCGKGLRQRPGLKTTGSDTAEVRKQKPEGRSERPRGKKGSRDQGIERRTGTAGEVRCQKLEAGRQKCEDRGEKR